MRYWQHVGLLVAVAGMWAADSWEMTNDGNELLQKCTAALHLRDTRQGDMDTVRDFAWCMAYLVGYVEGHQGATIFPLTICPLDGGRPVDQLARILVEWLRTHPAMLHEPRGPLTALAFRDAFPCPSALDPPPQQMPSGVPGPSSPKARKRK
jgi:hypothetical protein